MFSVFQETNKLDGFVSIELNPQLAFRIDESIKEARAIAAEIGLPNIMIKVPGTREGISVVRQLIREGINVNATLLFSPHRYGEVARAYIDALEERMNQGRDISDIHSVASFFISRIDSKVDGLIDKNALKGLRGHAATEGGKFAYGIFNELFFSDRFKALQAKGAWAQRLLWASTGTKDPAYSDVKYVEGLIAPLTINTLPPKTIDAFRDHGIVNQAIDDESPQGAKAILDEIEKSGISLTAIYSELEAEGIKAFETSYLDLLKAIAEKAHKLAG